MGAGLHLLVKPTGMKLWPFRYRFASKAPAQARTSFFILSEHRNSVFGILPQVTRWVARSIVALSKEVFFPPVVSNISTTRRFLSTVTNT